MAVKHEQIEVAHVSCSWSADFEFLGEVIIYQQFGGGMKYVLGEEGYSGIYPKPCLLLIGGGGRKSAYLHRALCGWYAMQR